METMRAERNWMGMQRCSLHAFTLPMPINSWRVVVHLAKWIWYVFLVSQLSPRLLISVFFNAMWSHIDAILKMCKPLLFPILLCVCNVAWRDWFSVFAISNRMAEKKRWPKALQRCNNAHYRLQSSSVHTDAQCTAYIEGDSVETNKKASRKSVTTCEPY